MQRPKGVMGNIAHEQHPPVGEAYALKQPTGSSITEGINYESYHFDALTLAALVFAAMAQPAPTAAPLAVEQALKARGLSDLEIKKILESVDAGGAARAFLRVAGSNEVSDLKKRVLQLERDVAYLKGLLKAEGQP